MKIMHHMTRADFEKAQDNVVVLPVGSTEQHGPHLPLGVDSYIARGISEILSVLPQICCYLKIGSENCH